MPRRTLQALEGDFEHQALIGLMHHLAHRAEAVGGVAADETVDLQQFLIGEAEIGLAHGHQLVAAVAARPDAEGVIGIIRRALAMAALGIHQHRVDDEGVALPFPPRAFRPAGQVERVAPLEHDAFDRRGVVAGRRRIFARGAKFVPGREWDEGREIDALIVESRDKAFQPRAALGKGPLAQILAAVGKQVVGTQMSGEFRDQLRRHGFAVEPLLQHVERLHPALAHDQQFAVDGAGQVQRVEQVGEAFGNVLAGARIKAGDCCSVVPGGDRLDPDAVPFPFRHEVARLEPGEIGVIERVRQHRRPERRRITARRFFRAAFEPGEQVEIGRRQPRPQQFDVLRVGAGERRDRGLGQPC